MRRGTAGRLKMPMTKVLSTTRLLSATEFTGRLRFVKSSPRYAVS